LLKVALNTKNSNSVIVIYPRTVCQSVMTHLPTDSVSQFSDISTHGLCVRV
jgi:hypothetical protein